MRLLLLVERLVGVLLLCAALATFALTTASAQTGRYQGTSEAREAFTRGQANASEGDRLLESGREERAMEAYRDAEEHYREALDIDDEFEEAWERLGYVLFVTGQSEEGVEALQEGLEQVPNSVSIRRMLGINLYEVDRTDEAISMLEGVDREGGATADVLFILAKHRYDARDYEGAIPYFQRYLVETPQDAATHGALGNAYLRTEQYEWALAEFRTVLDLDPTNLTARINMGDVYFASGDYARAIEIYDVVIPQDRENFRLWFNHGKAHLELEHYEQALESFTQLVRLREDLYQGHYFSGVALMETGDLDGARDALVRSSELEPSHALTQYRLGVVEARSGRLESAEAALERARELEPDEMWFSSALGDVYRRMGRTEEALRLHRRAVEEAPDEAQFHESLARDHFANGDLDRAAQTLEEALTLEPGLESAKSALGVTLLTQARAAIGEGRLDDAEANLQRAGELEAFPLETTLAEAALALAREDVDAAERLLEGVAAEHRTELSYRRATAHLYLARGQADRVTEALAEIADQSPEDLEPLDAGLLGHAAFAAGDWDRALALFDRAGDAEDTGPDAYRAHVALTHLRAGMADADRHRWNPANTHFEAAYDMREVLSVEDQARIEYAYGLSSLHVGNYANAQRHLDSALRQLDRIPQRERVRLPDDDDLEIELPLAYAHYRRGDYAEAIPLLEGLLRGRTRETAESLLASSHERLAMEAYERDDLRRAREHLEAAIETSPRDTTLRNNLACLRYGEGDRERAGDAFRELAESDEINVALYNYAVYLDEVERNNEAAHRYYRRYLIRGGDAEDDARRFAESKEEVFGFDADTN